MAEKKFSVLDLLDLELSGHDALQLKCIAGRRGLPRAITIPEINRPGLALSGFFENFAGREREIRVESFGEPNIDVLPEEVRNAFFFSLLQKITECKEKEKTYAV